MTQRELALQFTQERGFTPCDFDSVQGEEEDFDAFLKRCGYRPNPLEGDKDWTYYQRWTRARDGSSMWLEVFDVNDGTTCDLVCVATAADSLALRLKLNGQFLTVNILNDVRVITANLESKM